MTAPAPLSLRPFQDAGSAFLRRNARALLCDEAGLGKSAEVLDAAEKLGLKRILCVGPAVASVSWPLQLQTWTPDRAFVRLDVARCLGWTMPGFYFLSFDILSRTDRAALVHELMSCPRWDVLVIDEAQNLKTSHANRTRAVYGDNTHEGIANNAARVWVLSGTLTPNHAGEAYTHLRRLFPDVLAAVPAFDGRVPELWEFEERYTRYHDTVYGRVVDGSRNMLELRAHLAPVLLRRRKADVLKELAPIEWFDAPIGLDPARVRALLAAAGIDYDAALEATDAELESFVTTPGSVALSTQRHLLGLAKVPGCVDWITDRLEAGEAKIVVFAHHTDVLDALASRLALYEPVVFDGRTSPAMRARIVDQFQRDPCCRVFLGQLVAAGTSITLTAASVVFFVEFATTPGTNYQAACRPHRIGQPHGVQAYFGMVPDSLDQRFVQIARRRAHEIAELFD